MWRAVLIMNWLVSENRSMMQKLGELEGHPGPLRVNDLESMMKHTRKWYKTKSNIGKSFKPTGNGFQMGAINQDGY